MVIFAVRAEASKNALTSGLPIQKTNIRTDNQPFEDVSSPIKNCDFPASHVSLWGVGAIVI